MSPRARTLAAPFRGLCLQLLLLGGCVPLPSLPHPVDRAPPAARPVDILSVYFGAWFEVARTPEGLVRGCVAPRIDFSHTPDGGLWERQSCRMGTPTGREKVFAASAQVVDPPTNAELRTSYGFSGSLAQGARTIRVLDHGEDEGGWFIAAPRDFKALSIFTRTPQPSANLRARLVARAQALGFDTARLEFPPQPAA